MLGNFYFFAEFPSVFRMCHNLTQSLSIACFHSTVLSTLKSNGRAVPLLFFSLKVQQQLWIKIQGFLWDLSP
jgi:hypothetical protein